MSARLAMVDLDGTLIDTRKVNYLAYSEAVRPYGYEINWNYWCEYCNGRHYLDFLPGLTSDDPEMLNKIHEHKKAAYPAYLGEARLNVPLVGLLVALGQGGCKNALVTTASRQNAEEALASFSLDGLFDLVLTHDDICRGKPDPECYLKAMETMGFNPDECVAFEDSDVGIQAAEAAGVECFVVRGYS